MYLYTSPAEELCASRIVNACHKKAMLSLSHFNSSLLSNCCYICNFQCLHSLKQSFSYFMILLIFFNNNNCIVVVLSY